MQEILTNEEVEVEIALMILLIRIILFALKNNIFRFAVYI